MTTSPTPARGPAGLAKQMRQLPNKPDAHRLWRALVEQKGHQKALGVWRAALDIAQAGEPSRSVARAASVDTREPIRGRSRVGGEPTRHIPATATRGPRKAAMHCQVRLADGQRDAMHAHGNRLAMSAAQVLRAAAARLLAGDIPPPTDRAQIPAALPSEVGEMSWVPGPDQLDQLTAMGVRLQHVLIPEGTALPGPKGGRPGKVETETRDSLLRYALDRHLNNPEA